jgi:hypothetical protein
LDIKVEFRKCFAAIFARLASGAFYEATEIIIFALISKNGV